MNRRRTATIVSVVAALLIGLAAGVFLGRPNSTDDGGPVLGTVEIGFAQDMSIHHEQAISLCDNLAADVDPKVGQVCAGIRANQGREIGMLRGWLELYDLPQSSPTPMAWMGSEHHGGHDISSAQLPGMASWMEIDELRGLNGRAAEVRFLQLMLRHHQGGLDMAGYAAGHTDVAPIERIATGMVYEQTQEVLVMDQLLRDRSSAALPYP
ncbi:DUF305 domain-containing protein [Antrihabitans sp. YC3-6]|uniref:DUF305 domain-containing protein n=1 Tax=Antrihabitans stalagmiti TaxID=2799499 RepID=A0A934U4C3_9NOCA|nr:DUF305 domain-containing protein [Antrihabitans stalagmiti]MBJ8340232.1 DUF305 domain-containing protein [Antrihabitans stalagmiti]